MEIMRERKMKRRKKGKKVWRLSESG